ncbi:MAG: alanine--tRNA ligase [Chloroflexota bacterium]
MKPVSSDEIRSAFLEFFEEMGHTVVPSSPLPVKDNPTLFFTNAGMNQFVDTFLGKERRPYDRATSAQKCMRIQGKHNDLENVGPSPWHHTFFEMLGNFSFGDYFKEGAIRYAYSFLTKVCQIPEDRLWYTVHVSDDEAHKIWTETIGIPQERVLRMGDKTNFWMMGDVGPCGPTSEVHYDWGPEACTCGEENCSILLDNECGRWLEIWNLVFMQFNQDEDGVRTPLPNPGVDTGLGLERITMVQQQTPVAYDTDLFAAAMQRVQELLGHDEELRAEHETGYRVIADHGRAATFLIGDGVDPGSEGGSYVLRMIIRRAVRFGRIIGFQEPFLGEIAAVYIEKMGHVYPELKQRREHIVRTVTNEEVRFARTLDGALERLESILGELERSREQQISGETAFELHATYGLPLEITRDVAQEQGFSVDEVGFRRAREQHALASGRGAFDRYDTEAGVYGRLLADLLESGRLTKSGVDHDPYSGATADSHIVAILKDGEPVDTVEEGARVEVVTAHTPFYVEAGGEVSDTGRIEIPATGASFRVEDVQQPVTGLIVHMGVVASGTLWTGADVKLVVDQQRRWDIRRNHTATHILHRELRRHLGQHVVQKGSLVAPDRLRFDFTASEAVPADTLAAIEADVNAAILRNQPVNIEFMGQREAIEKGAMALFGEKYGDIVRTIRIGDEEKPYSFELCGGLHVNETGDIGLFRFTNEEAVGAGLRRVEAVTGRAAQKYVAKRLALLDDLARTLNTPADALKERVESLMAENRALQKQVEQLQRGQARDQFESLINRMQQVDGVQLLAEQVDVASADDLREMADWFRDKVNSGIAVFATVHDGKPLFVATVTEDVIRRGVRAGDLVRDVAKIVGGGGGGRPNLAQAGGRDASKVGEALSAVSELVKSSLEKGG